MILHLAGASETARAILTDRLLDDRKDWRHMAIEDIFEGEIPEELTEIDVFNVMIACNCAKEETEKGSHIVITFPLPGLVDFVKGELEEDHVTVFLGNDQVPSFDHTIDATACSMNETLGLLEKIIEKK